MTTCNEHIMNHSRSETQTRYQNPSHRFDVVRGNTNLERLASKVTVGTHGFAHESHLHHIVARKARCKRRTLMVSHLNGVSVSNCCLRSGQTVTVDSMFLSRLRHI